MPITTKEIASTLLERRSRLTHIIMPGDILGQLGPEGVQEALRRTWLESGYDTGALKVTGNMGLIADMERIAELTEGVCPRCNNTTCKCTPEPSADVTNGRRFALEHSNRLNEIAAFGTGQTDKPVAPITPASRPDIEANRSEDHFVGEDVIIAEEGKAYPGKVQSKNSDGTYKLSFGPNRPINSSRAYRKEEMQKVEPNDVRLVR